MSLQDRNLVSRKTAQELQRLILRNPGTAYSPHPARGGARGRMPVIVKCLSDTAIGGGGIGDEAYDAVMIAGHGTVASASQPELTPVWLTLWGDALGVETPTEDAIYHGIFAGDFDPDPGGAGTDRRPRVFAAAGAAGAATDSVWKEPVRVATTANGTLATSFENGDTVDGVTLATGNRILIKNQSSAAENGIYTVNASGAPTRATDADSGGDLVNAVVVVSEGTVNRDTIWMCTTNATIVVNTTALTWEQIYRGTLTQASLANSHSISSDDTWEQPSGVLVNLPGDGQDWEVTAVVDGFCSSEVSGGTGNGMIVARLWDATNSVAVLATQVVVWNQGAHTLSAGQLTSQYGSTTLKKVVNSGSGKQIRLEVARFTGSNIGTYNAALILAPDGEGNTSIVARSRA